MILGDIWKEQKPLFYLFRFIEFLIKEKTNDSVKLLHADVRCTDTTLSRRINNSTWNSNLNLHSTWNSNLSLLFNLECQFKWG